MLWMRPEREPARRYEYCKAPAEVEAEMLTQESTLVLMVQTPAEQEGGRGDD